MIEIVLTLLMGFFLGAMATDLAISLFNLFQSDRSPDMD